MCEFLLDTHIVPASLGVYECVNGMGEQLGNMGDGETRKHFSHMRAQIGFTIIAQPENGN